MKDCVHMLHDLPDPDPDVPQPSSPPFSLPFGFARRDYALALRNIPTRDLLAEIEAGQWLALDLADVPGDSRAVAEIQLEGMVEELERRKRLLEARTHDPLRPRWPRPEPDLKVRVETVKARWPIARFCTELLGCDLEPAGPARWKTRCPLPGHDDKTPSFVVYERDDRAWCFGCGRGGDVIALTGLAVGLERFHDKLDRLEAEGGPP